MDRYPNNSPKRSKILIGKWIGTALLAAVLVYFFLNPALYHKVITAADPSQGTTSAMDYGQIIATLLLTALGIAALWAPCPFSAKQKKILGPAGFLLTSGVSIFALEYANIYVHRLPWEAVHSIGLKKLFLTWTVVILIAAWFAVLTNRWQLSSVLTAAVICVFGVVCYFVYALRGVAFLATDLTTIQTAANVVGGYEYHVDSYTFTLILFTIVWCDVIKWTGKEKIFRTWKRRGVACVCVLALTILSDRVYLHTEMLRHRGVTVNTFRPEKSETTGRS